MLEQFKSPASRKSKPHELDSKPEVPAPQARDFQKYQSNSDKTSVHKTSEEDLRIIYAGMLDHAIIRTDSGGTILNWSPGAENILGWREEEVIGKPCSIIFTKENQDFGAAKLEISTTAALGKADESRWLLRKDGTRFFATGSFSPVKDSNGKVSGYVKVFRDAAYLKSIVHEDERAQKILQESDAQFKALADSVPGGIYITNADGGIIYQNQRFWDYVGHSPLESTGWKWKDLPIIHPDDLQNTLKTWSRAQQFGESFETEYRLRRYDGEYQWFLTRAYPYRDGTGKIARWYGTNTNIHEQKIASVALEKSERRLIEATATTGLGVWEANLDTGVAWRTESHDKIYGFDKYDPSRNIDFFFNLIIEEDAPRVRREFEAAIMEHKHFHVEYKIKNQSGSIRCIEVNGDPAYDSMGKAVSFLGTIRDITDEVTIRNLMQESETRARLIANSLPLIVWTATPDGHVDWFNDWWYEYLNIPRGSDKECPEIKSMHPDDLILTNKIWNEKVAAGEAFSMEQRYRRGSDGQFRWHLVRGVPIRDGSGKVTKYIGGNTDIHEQKMLAEQLKEARKAADAANKAKSLFLANMSHEIRTPIGVIEGFADLLAESSLGTEEARWVEIIGRNTRQLTNLIGEVLDLAKVEAGQLEVERVRFPLSEIIDDIREAMLFKAEEKGLALLFEIEPGLPHFITSDPTRFRQILINLIGNAIKFTHAGTVSVRISQTLAPAKKLSVCVTDTGIGLSNEQREKIFVPFVQADSSMTRRFGGTGLGLSISRRLAQALGGDLRIARSELGVGSTFELTLSCFDTVDELSGSSGNASVFASVAGNPPAPLRGSPTTSSFAEASLSFANTKILVVEDSPDIRWLVSHMLKQAGAHVTCEVNGRLGSERALKEDFDVVLMDIQMPEMDGYEAVKFLREAGYTKPIIALTAHALKEERERAIRLGFAAYVTKPISKAVLQRVLTNVLTNALTNAIISAPNH